MSLSDWSGAGVEGAGAVVVLSAEAAVATGAAGWPFEITSFVAPSKCWLIKGFKSDWLSDSWSFSMKNLNPWDNEMVRGPSRTPWNVALFKIVYSEYLAALTDSKKGFHIRWINNVVNAMCSC